MSAVVAQKYLGNDFSSLVPIKISVPTLAKDGDVLVQVVSAAVNPIDWKVVDGFLNSSFPLVFPQKLGCDMAGMVVACRACERLKVGDAVWSDMGAGRTSGSFAEYALASEGGVGLKPASLSFGEAATLPLVSKTMYQAIQLVSPGKSSPPSLTGKNVLITSGSGGTGFVGIQVICPVCVFRRHI
jgi:alcohol dehydrogenase